MFSVCRNCGMEVGRNEEFDGSYDSGHIKHTYMDDCLEAIHTHIASLSKILDEMSTRQRRLYQIAGKWRAKEEGIGRFACGLQLEEEEDGR